MLIVKSPMCPNCYMFEVNRCDFKGAERSTLSVLLIKAVMEKMYNFRVVQKCIIKCGGCNRLKFQLFHNLMKFLRLINIFHVCLYLRDNKKGRAFEIKRLEPEDTLKLSLLLSSKTCLNRNLHRTGACSSGYLLMNYTNRRTCGHIDIVLLKESTQSYSL